MRTSNNDIRREHMCTLQPNKVQANSRTDKDERSILNITYRDRKTNIWVREKKYVKEVIRKVRRGNGLGQGTTAGHEITDGHCI